MVYRARPALLLGPTGCFRQSPQPELALAYIRPRQAAPAQAGIAAHFRFHSLLIEIGLDPQRTTLAGRLAQRRRQVDGDTLQVAVEAERIARFTKREARPPGQTPRHPTGQGGGIEALQYPRHLGSAIQFDTPGQGIDVGIDRPAEQASFQAPLEPAVVIALTPGERPLHITEGHFQRQVDEPLHVDVGLEVEPKAVVLSQQGAELDPAAGAPLPAPIVDLLHAVDGDGAQVAAYPIGIGREVADHVQHVILDGDLPVAPQDSQALGVIDLGIESADTRGESPLETFDHRPARVEGKPALFDLEIQPQSRLDAAAATSERQMQLQLAIRHTAGHAGREPGIEFLAQHVGR